MMRKILGFPPKPVTSTWSKRLGTEKLADMMFETDDAKVTNSIEGSQHLLERPEIAALKFGAGHE